VTFEILPAIDVAGGRLARFHGRGSEPVEAFGGDPLAAAASFADVGAIWLHVVDLDLALTGEARNLDVISRIAGLGAKVQASGGVTSEASAGAMIDAGASRVVLGSAALADPTLLALLAERLGDRVAVGIEVEGDRIRPRGSAKELSLAGTLDWLALTGAVRFVVTSVARVGRARGPDLEATRAVIPLGRPVLAAGGIATMDDIRSLEAIGAAGAIVGRAALQGDLDLAAALALGGEPRSEASGSPSPP
jgi:phosphoribosylformimino-5-aminoimidazole carboxamide ribonucleotide (ProFAR) isomerase